MKGCRAGGGSYKVAVIEMADGTRRLVMAGSPECWDNPSAYRACQSRDSPDGYNRATPQAEKEMSCGSGGYSECKRRDRCAGRGMSAVPKAAESPRACLPARWQIVGRSSGRQNRCRGPFVGVASSVEVGYPVPDGAHLGRIGFTWMRLLSPGMRVPRPTGRCINPTKRSARAETRWRHSAKPSYSPPTPGQSELAWTANTPN